MTYFHFKYSQVLQNPCLLRQIGNLHAKNSEFPPFLGARSNGSYDQILFSN